MEKGRKRKSTEDGLSRYDELERIRASIALRSQLSRESTGTSLRLLSEHGGWRPDIGSLLSESRQSLVAGDQTLRQLEQLGQHRREEREIRGNLSNTMSFRHMHTHDSSVAAESRERKRPCPVSLTREEADRRLAAELSRPLLPPIVSDSERLDSLVPFVQFGRCDDLEDRIQERRRALERETELLDRQLEALLAQRRSSTSTMLPPGARTQAHLPRIDDAVTSIIENGANQFRDFPQSSALASAMAAERYSSSEDPPTQKHRAVFDCSRSDKAKTPNAKICKGNRVREEDRWTRIPTASQMKVPNQGKGQVIPMSNHDDRANLTPYQAVIRESLEYFTATQDDAATKIQGRRKPVVLNQLGIRCKYCSHLPVSKRKRAAAYYPRTLPNLYQGAQNIASIHFSRCTEFPKHILDFLTTERPRKVFSKFGRPYWADMCLELGIYEEEHALWLSSATRGDDDDHPQRTAEKSLPVEEQRVEF